MSHDAAAGTGGPETDETAAEPDADRTAAEPDADRTAAEPDADRTAAEPEPVRAAGGVVWRPRPAGGIEVCLIHRDRYDDWSLPKGKLDADEHPLAAAVREVAEETGLRAVPQVRLPTIRYRLGTGAAKSVDYWSMRAVDDPGFTPNVEVDDVRWVPPAEAVDRLSYDHDADLVRRAAALPAVTAVVLLLRHAYAGKRADWAGPDSSRPLADRGRRQAAALAELLGPAFAPGRVLAAPPVRCRDTVAPLAGRVGRTVELDAAFEEGAEAAGALARLRELGRTGDVSVLCSQGKLIPKVLAELVGGPADGFGTAKGDGWLLAFAGDDLVGHDRLHVDQGHVRRSRSNPHGLEIKPRR